MLSTYGVSFAAFGTIAKEKIKTIETKIICI